MKQKSRETGHYKNVASFQALVQQCQLLGGAYQPSRVDLGLTALQLKQARAGDVMQRLYAAESTLSAKAKQRGQAFINLPSLGVRIVAALMFSDPASKLIDAAKHHLSKLRGVRMGKMDMAKEDVAGAPEAHHVSVRQTSYDALLAHFTRLVETVELEPQYKPNEPELSMETLHTVVGSLTAQNAAVVDAQYIRHQLIKERDEVLYDAHAGIVPAAASIKLYLKMVFGNSSMELKAARALVFRSGHK